VDIGEKLLVSGKWY